MIVEPAVEERATPMGAGISHGIVLASDPRYEEIQAAGPDPPRLSLRELHT